VTQIGSVWSAVTHLPVAGEAENPHWPAAPQAYRAWLATQQGDAKYGSNGALNGSL